MYVVQFCGLKIKTLLALIYTFARLMKRLIDDDDDDVGRLKSLPTSQQCIIILLTVS